MVLQRNIYDPQQEVHFCESLRRNVAKYPDKVALKMGDDQVTYTELDKITDAIADFLKSNDIGVGDIVAVAIPRSVNVMLSVIGIWKTRAAFIYLDANAPKERNDFILADSRCRFIVTPEMVDGIRAKIDTLTPSKHPVGALTDLGFILFTSGSTGFPKGTMLEQGGIAAQNLLSKYMGMMPDDTQSMLASFSFMAAIFEGFPLLSIGGTLVLVPQEARRDLDSIIQCFEENKVTIGFMPPHLAGQFVRSGRTVSTLRLMLCGGEPARNMDKRPYDIICVYGSSETGGPVLFQRIDYKAESYPIGKSWPFMKVYVLDADGYPVKPGEIGEVCAAGPQLAVGYMNQAEMTEKKFVENQLDNDPRYDRICRTGDMARLEENGDSYFVCRKDLMVKIRSFRIELEEVEAGMNKHTDIERGFAKPFKKDDGEDALCGYYFAKEPIDPKELRQFLRDNLPHYMVPERFVHLTEMKLTDNGKPDRSSLKHPDEYIEALR